MFIVNQNPLFAISNRNDLKREDIPNSFLYKLSENNYIYIEDKIYDLSQEDTYYALEKYDLYSSFYSMCIEWAVTRSYNKLVMFLLNRHSEEIERTLILAIQKSDSELVKSIVDTYFDNFNANPDRFLVNAIYLGTTEIFNLLWDYSKKSKIDISNQEYYTVIHRLIAKTDTKMLDTVLPLLNYVPLDIAVLANRIDYVKKAALCEDVRQENDLLLKMSLQEGFTEIHDYLCKIASVTPQIA